MYHQKRLILMIQNKLYDLTEFSKIHPGGELLLWQLNRKDATKDFKRNHHSRGAKLKMQNFIINRPYTSLTAL